MHDLAALCPTCLYGHQQRLANAQAQFQVLELGYSPQRPCASCAAASTHLLIQT